MEWLKHIGVRVWPIPLTIALLSTLPGCGEETSEFEKASKGQMKTPTEINNEAKAKAKAAQAAAPKAP